MTRPLRPAVTTVVMTRDRRADLLATLPRHQTPVIVVDNGSSDGTVPAVQRLGRPDIRVIALPRNLGAVARNIGVRAATTPYVAFADDDSWWAPGALTRAAAVLDEYPRLGLLAGRLLVGAAEHEDPVSRQMRRSPFGCRPERPGPDVLGFLACAAVVRRVAFLECGGFDDVVFFPGEEERLAIDLAAAGWWLTYVEDVVAHHHPSRVRPTAGPRQRLLTRNAILTAVMRRPWPVVGRRVVQAMAAGWPQRRGVVTAVPRVPRALRRRRIGPDGLERRLARAERVMDEVDQQPG